MAGLGRKGEVGEEGEVEGTETSIRRAITSTRGRRVAATEATTTKEAITMKLKVMLTIRLTTSTEKKSRRDTSRNLWVEDTTREEVEEDTEDTITITITTRIKGTTEVSITEETRETTIGTRTTTTTKMVRTTRRTTGTPIKKVLVPTERSKRRAGTRGR